MEFASSHPWKDVLDSYLNSTNDKILIADTFQIIDYNSNHSEPFKILNERIVSYFEGYRHYDPLINILRRIIGKFTEAGIIDQMSAMHHNFSLLRPEPEPSEPIVFTMSHLAIGFKLFGICIIVSAFSFIYEHIIDLISKVFFFIVVFKTLRSNFFRHF